MKPSGEIPSAPSAGGLSKADERLALRQAPVKSSGRRYRCSMCGVFYPTEDLNPDFDEEGRQVGWACGNCY